MEQEALFRWVRFSLGKWPELRLLYHIPNEGRRSVAAGAAMKRQGLRAGVPDLCLPVARGGFHALYIELKAVGGKPTGKQEEWLEELRAQDNAAYVAYGWEQAAERIQTYMRGQSIKIERWSKQ
jgi:hypothetical protein